MEHVGIVVDDLAAATAFFVELGRRAGGADRLRAPAGDARRISWVSR
jgi:catechol 2,3-dioxygenase-like lactoylglutathione lyase family enzyme